MRFYFYSHNNNIIRINKNYAGTQISKPRLLLIRGFPDFYKRKLASQAYRPFNIIFILDFTLTNLEDKCR